ncbi:hypothetical protein FRC16_006757 [Serendipita sp. 398]|nr:hypothetical protein FRC16_006757 [Serendipita sp. 398]
MLVLTLLFASLAPLSAIAGTPGALRSLSGKDYSHHLKRTDEPFPARFSYTRRGPGSVPPTLKVRAEPVLPGKAASRVPICVPTGMRAAQQVQNAAQMRPFVVPLAPAVEMHAARMEEFAVALLQDAAMQEIHVKPSTEFPDVARLCAGETFCCPSGETCGRDPNGNATCNGQSASESQGVAASPTPGDTSIVNPSNTSSSSQASTTRRTSTSAAPTSTGSHTTTTPASTTSSSTGNGFSVMPSRDTFGLVGAVALVLVAFA